ncbi:MAG: hypothetical protein LC650_02265 [Actinobacteria bacterium]|nr:hypothetical protein [Actinomycetota bacterium]
MYFAEFWDKSATSNQLIPACGDRSVYILDGRNTLTTQIDDAHKWAKTHGYKGFEIRKGPQFTRARAISSFIFVK